MAVTSKAFLSQKQTKTHNAVIGSWIDNEISVNKTTYTSKWNSLRNISSPLKFRNVII